MAASQWYDSWRIAHFFDHSCIELAFLPELLERLLRKWTIQIALRGVDRSNAHRSLLDATLLHFLYYEADQHGHNNSHACSSSLGSGPARLPAMLGSTHLHWDGIAVFVNMDEFTWTCQRFHRTRQLLLRVHVQWRLIANRKARRLCERLRLAGANWLVLSRPTWYHDSPQSHYHAYRSGAWHRQKSEALLPEASKETLAKRNRRDGRGR